MMFIILSKRSWIVIMTIICTALMPVFAWGQNFSEISGAADSPAVDSAEVIKGEDATDADILALVSEPGMTGDPDASRYTLGPEDVISISVLRHPEVSGSFIINKEGKIQYAFVGDIEIAGLTKDEAAELIKNRLAEYIVSPEVSMTITGYNSKIVYVVGEVGRPGKIYMRGDTISVLEALIEAGLPQLTGVTKKSRLITPSETGQGDRRDVNVYALLYEGDLRENLVMKPGDVLYIPPTFLTKTMRAIQPVTAPLTNAAGASRSVYTGGF